LVLWSHSLGGGVPMSIGQKDREAVMPRAMVDDSRTQGTSAEENSAGQSPGGDRCDLPLVPSQESHGQCLILPVAVCDTGRAQCADNPGRSVTGTWSATSMVALPNLSRWLHSESRRHVCCEPRSMGPGRQDPHADATRPVPPCTFPPRSAQGQGPRLCGNLQ
jgi:hypothetical protein